MTEKGPGEYRRPTAPTESRLGPAKPVTPYVPPGKGPVEPERVAGISNPKCTACLEEIKGPYRTAVYGKYHYHNDAAHPGCETSREIRVAETTQEIAIAAAMYTTSALGVPVAEIRENVLPSNEKVLEKVAGRKDDSGKERYTLLPWDALREVVKVLEYGAKKYAPENWRKVLYPKVRYSDATLRHLTAWGMGERLDPETGLHHLAHAACCILFMLSLDLLPDPRKPVWSHGNQE